MLLVEIDEDSHRRYICSKERTCEERFCFVRRRLVGTVGAVTWGSVEAVGLVSGLGAGLGAGRGTGEGLVRTVLRKGKRARATLRAVGFGAVRGEARLCGGRGRVGLGRVASTGCIGCVHLWEMHAWYACCGAQTIVR